MHRIIAGMLALVLAVGTACSAQGELGIHFLRHRVREENRAWWGVLYGDALLLAQAEEGEETPEDETAVVFVWPLWEWLLRFLGFQ